MSVRLPILWVTAVLLLSVVAVADSNSLPKPADNSAVQKPMSKDTRMLVVRSFAAEFVFLRHMLPRGGKAVTTKDGQIVSPSESELEQLTTKYGLAAKTGERVQITKIDIKNDKITFEINGGPKKKSKWYRDITISGAGGTVQPPSDGAHNPDGAMVELDFDGKFVPEMSCDQIRALLAPVFNFNAKSEAEAYLDVAPPKVRQAIQNHQVLVGMDREMVRYALGRPRKKIREKDQNGMQYEEWLYGAPPQEAQFVRFVGNEVVRLEIMKADGEKIVRTQKEVDLKPAVAANREQAKPAVMPAQGPTLRRPGEQREEFGTE